MSHVLNLPNRLTFGIAALALLAIAATTTTLATRPSHAASPNDATCAQQDALPDGTEPVGADADTADVQCGDQTGVDASGAESTDEGDASGTDTDSDQTEEGDQTTPDAPGSVAK